MEFTMENRDKMLSAASGAMEYIFNPGPNDKVLILTDTNSAAIAEAFKQASIKKGCTVESYEIKSNERPLIEIPEELEKLLQGKTIVLNIISAYAEEIPFRIKWLFKIEENKLLKTGHMPGITEEMMLNSVNVDFGAMKAMAGNLINALKNTVRIHITTDKGTDLLLGVAGRKFVGDIGVEATGMCNIPCGEIYCAPLETEANGVIVFDASIGDVGLLKQPLKVYLNDGKIIKLESNDRELEKRIAELTDVDDEARVIGELGIGVNAGARITGNMLEDEKTLGTAHIAFGNNEDFPGGGKNRSKIHRDYLMFKPTIEAQYANGGKKLLMKNGQLLKS
jgi:leucyl aminopeptidase (aminopeptidase T)